MNIKIKEQLDKCNVILPFYNENTLELLIPKGSSFKQLSLFSNDLEVGKEYKIKVERYIVNPPEGFDLHINWNSGLVPTDEYMKIKVDQIMGKMIKVKAVGINDNKPWAGWLPRKSINIIEENY